MYRIKIANKEYELNTSSYVLIVYKKDYGKDITSDLKVLNELSKKEEIDFDLICRIILTGIKTQLLAKGIKEFNDLDYLLQWEVSDITNEETINSLTEYITLLLGQETTKDKSAPNSKK